MKLFLLWMFVSRVMLVDGTVVSRATAAGVARPEPRRVARPEPRRVARPEPRRWAWRVSEVSAAPRPSFLRACHTISLILARTDTNSPPVPTRPPHRRRCRRTGCPGSTGPLPPPLAVPGCEGHSRRAAGGSTGGGCNRCVQLVDDQQRVQRRYEPVRIHIEVGWGIVVWIGDRDWQRAGVRIADLRIVQLIDNQQRVQRGHGAVVVDIVPVVGILPGVLHD